MVAVSIIAYLLVAALQAWRTWRRGPRPGTIGPPSGRAPSRRLRAGPGRHGH